MRIKCVHNKCFVHRKNTSYVQINENFHEIEYPVIVGKEYIVYAMVVRDGFTRYFIADENYSYYPNWIPPILFEIVDRRLSRFWTFSYEFIQEYNKEFSTWAYSEWTNDLEHYDRLTDREDADVQIWYKYKEKMELEFFDDNAWTYAQIGDDIWLICPECIDAWQSTNALDALVICPKCKTLLINPRYIDSSKC